jgi:hypothetical protein
VKSPRTSFAWIFSARRGSAPAGATHGDPLGLPFALAVDEDPPGTVRLPNGDADGLFPSFLAQVGRDQSL